MRAEVGWAGVIGAQAQSTSCLAPCPCSARSGEQGIERSSAWLAFSPAPNADINWPRSAANLIARERRLDGLAGAVTLMERSSVSGVGHARERRMTADGYLTEKSSGASMEDKVKSEASTDDNGRDMPSSWSPPSGSTLGLKHFRGLISAVLVGALVLGAVYYLHSDREEASSERTPPPTSTAVAPASQPSVPDQRASAPNAPGEQAKAAPAPSPPAPFRNEQATSSVTPAAGLRTGGPAKPQDQSNRNDGATKPEQPNPNDRATKPEQPNPNDRAAKPDPAAASTLQDQAASLPATEVVFVQKPGVKIRSEPNKRSRVVGSTTKGQQFTVKRRAGHWVQIDTGNGQGWIGARLLGSQSP